MRLAPTPMTLLEYDLESSGKDKIFGTTQAGRYKSMRRMIVVAIATVIAAMLGVAVVGAQDSPRILCTWDRPDSGSPVQFYELEITDVDATVDTLLAVPAQPGVAQTYVFEGDYLRRYIARVRGVDDQQRRGPWSGYSPIYVFEQDEPEP